MIIKNCRIQAFGSIEELLLDDLDHPLVVILGPNESGKTTLFEFFKTMLYGIYPTAPESHPYAPWTGDRLEGHMTYETADGGERTIVRRLGRGPEGKFLNGKRENIRNRTVPEAAHISRELFESLYALSIEDMAALKDKPWDEVQERLLGRFGNDGLNPVRKVLRELDSEATSLWREDNRGKPAAKVIERQILDLRSEGRKAEQRDRTARSLSESIQHLSEQLARLESKERQLRARQSQFERLMPIRNLMRQVDQNRQQAGDISPWQFIAEDPLQRVETLKEEIDVLRHEKSQKETRLERLKEKIDGFSEHEEALARLSGEIRAWATRLGGLEQIRELLGEARERLRHCEERIEKQGRELFMEDWNTSLTDKVLAVPVREIRSALREYQSCQEDVRRSAEKRTKRISGWEKHLLPLAVLLAAFGLTSGTLSLFLPGRVLLPAGGVLILLAISMMALRWLLDRSNRLDIQAELGKTDSEVCVISDRLIDLFGGLPLGTQGIEGWDAYRVSDLRELRDSVVDKRAQQQRELNHQQQISCLEKQFGEWAQKHGIEVSGTPLMTVAQLESDVREAEGRKAQLSQLEASASELTNLLEPMESELRRLQTELTRLTSALEELGEGSVKQGAEVLLKRRKADDAAEHFQRALDTEFPDWEELKPQIADLETRSTLSTFQDETARLHAELEETTQQIRKFSAEKAAKAEELHQIESLPTRADIESEIAFLDRRLSDIHFKRDRLALLSQLVRRGEELFREKHQPDVLKRAGSFLGEISRQRWNRLDFDEGLREFLVCGEGSAHTLKVGRPLSRGTLDQIYLSLRLALVEHLDAGHDPLPLFLDELLLNWDADRRQQGLKVLDKLSSKRQVFQFTCHAWLAEELRKTLTAKVVSFPLAIRHQNGKDKTHSDGFNTRSHS